MEMGKSNLECDEEPIKIEYCETNDEDPLKLIKPREKPVETVKEEYKDVTVENTDAPSETDDIHFCIQEPTSSEINRTKHAWFKEVDETGKLLCNFCHLCYLSVQTIRRHVLTKHPHEASHLKDKVAKNKRNHRYKCHICKSTFTVLPKLQEHVKQIHRIEDSKSFCHVCHASFDDDNQLSAHKLAEHNIPLMRIYTCKTCGYQTKKISHLNQHLNTHSEERSHKCQFCDYKTNYLPNLKIHERIHNNSKPYRCPIAQCIYQSVTRTGLRSHMLKHNQENMLYCDKCMYKTVYKQSLKKHTESHSRNMAKIVL